MKDRGAIFLIGLGVLAALLLWWLLAGAGQGAPGPLPPAPTLTANGRTLFTIEPGQATAEFRLGEVLRGQATDVIGATDQVTGSLAVDLNDLATAEIGRVQIAAGTLRTDNNLRNTALYSYILYTDVYPFITFDPVAVAGLPAAADIGVPLTFTVSGDLTIVGVTQTATFMVTAVAESATRLAGQAVTSVRRTDWELAIPSVNGVADVDEAVELHLDFTATAVP